METVDSMKEMDQINEYQVFKGHCKAKYNPKSKQITHAPKDYQKINVHLVSHASVTDATKLN